MPFIFLSAVLLLTIYSYTQIDLNLTLLNWRPYLQLQNQFIQLGYFQRPLSALILLIILVTFAVSYLLLMRAAYKNKLSASQLKKIIIAAAVILTLGYTAFSHDLFNYIFDAKILTYYHLNPYQYRALDFPEDTWTRFMQWTHRTYPYGPVWLVMTAIPSVLGLGKFLLTYTLFRLLFLASYLYAVRYFYKIAKLYAGDKAVFATTIFALHPLVLIESILSPHIDITMIAIGLAAIYYLLQNRPYSRRGWLLLITSAATKFATGLYAPIFLLLPQKATEVHAKIKLLFIFSLLAVLLQTLSQLHLQPWYFLMPLSILPLLIIHRNDHYIARIAIIFMLPLWIYLYFVYSGQWINALWFI